MPLKYVCAVCGGHRLSVCAIYDLHLRERQFPFVYAIIIAYVEHYPLNFEFLV